MASPSSWLDGPGLVRRLGYRVAAHRRVDRIGSVVSLRPCERPLDIGAFAKRDLVRGWCRDERLFTHRRADRIRSAVGLRTRDIVGDRRSNSQQQACGQHGQANASTIQVTISFAPGDFKASRAHRHAVSAPLFKEKCGTGPSSFRQAGRPFSQRCCRA